MEAITQHSIDVATDNALILWALSSTEYPKQHKPMNNAIVKNVIDVATIFSINCRRAMEVLPKELMFKLDTPRWQWQPVTEHPKINNLREATNRIIHAKKLLIGLENLPKNLSVIVGESVFIPYIQAETDRKELAFIDPFAMAHSFLYGALPELQKYFPEHA